MQAVRQKPQYKSKLSSLKIFGLHNSGSISKTDGKNSQHEPFILSLSIMIKVQVIILFPLYPSSLFPFILKWEGQIYTTGPKLLLIFSVNLKSVNLQYNTLVRKADGTNNLPNKRLMFQVLFFFVKSSKILCKNPLFF